MQDIRKEVTFDGRCTLHLGQVVISDLSEDQADAIVATYRRVSDEHRGRAVEVMASATDMSGVRPLRW